MTSIAVIASICASASEAALLVACFVPISLDLGVTHRGAKALTTVMILLGTPRADLRFVIRPHQATIDRAKVEQQCGANLTRA